MLDVAVRGDTVAAGTYTVIDPNKKTAEAGEAEGDFNSVDGVCKDIVGQGVNA